MRKRKVSGKSCLIGFFIFFNFFIFLLFYFLTSDNLLTVRLLFDAVLDENNDKTWQWREFFAKRLETALSKVILRKDTPKPFGGGRSQTKF